MKDLKMFIKYIKPYKIFYIILFPLALIVTAAALPVPLIIKYMIDGVTKTKDIGMLNRLALIIISLYAVGALSQYILKYVYTYFGNKINVDIRKEVFQHIQSLPLSYLNTQTVGSIVSRVMNDVAALNGILTSSIFLEIISNSFIVFFVVVVLFSLNWKLTLLNLALVPMYWLITRKYSGKIRKISKEIQEQSANTVGNLSESISNQKIIRAFNRENIFLNKFLDELKKLIGLYLKSYKASYTVQQLTFLISSASPLIVFWYGIILVLNGSMTIGGLIAFYQYILQVYNPLGSFMNFNVQIQAAQGAMSRIVEFFNIKTEENDDGLQVEDLKGSIVFKNVSFSYNNNEKVLKNISFKVEPGEFVGIVGPSGAGKTTISNILLKFFSLDEGEIYFDSYSIKDISSKSLRDHIGIVTQEPYLFKATIEDNIRLGKLDSTFEEIRHAAGIAQIDEFVMGLPYKYDSMVDERGLNLSGGQKQRISLARVFLKNPRIFIFDEATSSLDSNLESLIQITIENTMKGSTCIAIAHRLSTVMKADRILVLNNGEIVEVGTHNDLVKQKGLYHSLYRQQFELKDDFGVDIKGRIYV